MPKCSYACDQCPLKYNKLKYLVAHRKQSHKKAPNYTCGDCGHEFMWKKELTEHCKRTHGLKTLSCEICNKECHSDPSLRYHKKTHTRPYQCELCPKAFFQKVKFSRHMTKKHKGNKQPLKKISTSSTFLVKTVTMIQAFKHQTSNSTSSDSDGYDLTIDQSETFIQSTSVLSSGPYRADSKIANDSSTSADSMNNAEPSPVDHLTSVDQLSNTDSTNSARKLYSNCQLIDPLGPMVKSSSVEKTCSIDSVIDNHLEGSWHMFQISANNHAPATGMADTLIRKTTYPVGDDNELDTSYTTSPNYMPSPEYIPVGPFGFKDFGSNDIDLTPNDYSTVTEQDIEQNNGASVNNSMSMKVDKNACSDIEHHVPMDLDKYSSPASDCEKQHPEQQQDVLVEKPSNSFKLSGKGELEDAALDDNNLEHTTTTTSEPANLTGKSQTTRSRNANNELVLKQPVSSTNNTENRYINKKENGKKCKFCDGIFKDTSDLQVHEEKCVEICATKNVSKNGDIIYACKVCQVLFKDLLSFAVHEIMCSETSDIVEISSDSECSSIMEQGSDLNQEGINEMEEGTTSHRKQTFVSSNSENSFPTYHKKGGLKEIKVEIPPNRKQALDIASISENNFLSKKKHDLNEMKVGTVAKRNQASIPCNSENSFPSYNTKEELNEMEVGGIPWNRKQTDVHDQTFDQQEETDGQEEMVDGVQKIVNPEIFRCIHCAMTFRLRLEHYKHELSHELAATIPTGVRYICIICGGTFDMTDKLIQHVAYHEEVHS